MNKKLQLRESNIAEIWTQFKKTKIFSTCNFFSRPQNECQGELLETKNNKNQEKNDWHFYILKNNV